MGRVEGKVALITGAARGQGRAHAERLAEEGADVVGFDLAAPLETVAYPAATPDDLRETVRAVEARGRRALAHRGDVRDQAALDAAVRDAVEQLGRVDVVCANAGIVSLNRTWEVSDAQWDELIGVNLTGVWRTVRAAVPAMIAAGRGGSIVLTASIAGVQGMPGLGHYVAAKHGVVGLMRALANELAEHRIRVNCVAPTNVDTPMIRNPNTFGAFRPDLETPTEEDVAPVFSAYHLLDTPWVESRDVSEAVLWLASDESRWTTGAVIPVDAGCAAKFPA